MFGLRSQFSAELGNEQATDTLPHASSAMSRICRRRVSCASAGTTERVKSIARRMWFTIGTPATPGMITFIQFIIAGSKPLPLTECD